MRLLAMIEVHVTPQERSSYLAGLKATRAAATSNQAHFWVFENEQEPGRFVEFTEAADAEHIASIHGGRLPARALWREVQGA